MNKSRIIGIILFIVGVIGQMYFKHPIAAFLSGGIITIGAALIILGRPIFKRKE